MNNDQTAILGLVFYLTMLFGVFGLMLYDQKKIREKTLDKPEEYFKC